MKVTLEPHIAKSLIVKDKEVRAPQYRVRVDGRCVGFMPFKEGAKLLLTERFGPIELEEIEQQVAALMKNEDLQSAMAPDVPEEVRNVSEEDKLEDDDFE